MNKNEKIAEITITVGDVAEWMETYHGKNYTVGELKQVCDTITDSFFEEYVYDYIADYVNDKICEVMEKEEY